MISIKEYSKDNYEEWNKFLVNAKNSLFMFNRDYMEYHSDRFCDNSLMFYEDDELIALLPLNKSNNALCSHGGLTFGGFVTNEKMRQHRMIECFEVLKQYMKENNIQQLQYKVVPHIYHKIPAQEDLYALFKIGAELLKIEPTTTIMFSNPIKMKKGRKAQISRARREGVVVEESLDFDAFMAIESDVLKEKYSTKPVHTAEELKLLQSKFPDNIKMYVSKLNNEIIAGAVIFVYPNLVHTQYLGTTEKAREIGALDLVISEMINKYKDEKKFFDFGRSTEDDGKYLNEGLISQKEGFGGRTIIHSTFVLK